MEMDGERTYRDAVTELNDRYDAAFHEAIAEYDGLTAETIGTSEDSWVQSWRVTADGVEREVSVSYNPRINSGRIDFATLRKTPAGDAFMESTHGDAYMLEDGFPELVETIEQKLYGTTRPSNQGSGGTVYADD